MLTGCRHSSHISTEAPSADDGLPSTSYRVTSQKTTLELPAFLPPSRSDIKLEMGVGIHRSILSDRTLTYYDARHPHHWNGAENAGGTHHHGWELSRPPHGLTSKPTRERKRRKQDSRTTTTQALSYRLFSDNRGQSLFSAENALPLLLIA
ncbi:hypothetical protein BJY01DRAFT_124515 [Aspergillus pseudoustus]|uniref:Uncharacterized protein n=1 Tax=Aspergillus pseudoustus TaxID=1810923 RepID=A0ABR4IPP2_9EURO